MPDDDKLGAALSALSPEQLQQLHTATYQIRTGAVSGNFDTAKVGRLWDAIQPVVARGGGPEKSAQQQVAMQSAAPGNRPGGVFTPSSGAQRGMETILSRAEGGGITDPSQFESYLQNPALPKTQWQAFQAGVAESGTQLAAGNFATPGGAVMNLLPLAEAKLLKTGAEALQAVRSSMNLSRGAEAAGETAAAVQHAADAHASLQTAIRAKQVLQGTAAARGTVSAGFAGQGAYQAVTGRDDAEKIAGLVQFMQGSVGMAGDVMGYRGAGRSMMAKAVPGMEPPGATPMPPRAPQLPESASPAGTPVTPAATPTPSTPESTIGPKEAKLATVRATTPEFAAAQRDEMISRAKAIQAHPAATPEDQAYAAKQLEELGAALPRTAPLAPPSVQDIAKGITATNRPKDLPQEQLQQIASLNQKDALAAGLKRDDWLAARAAMKRISGPVSVQPPATPSENVHITLNRALKGLRPGDVVPAVAAMANQPVPEQEKLAASMDRRSVAAQQQLDELNRVVNSKDTAAEITELLHGRVGLSEVKGGDIGVDAQGRTVVQPGTEEGGDKVTSRYGYKYDVSDSQRQVLNFILSDRAPTGTRWTERNEEGRAIPPRKLSDEDKAFVAQQHGVMAGKIAEIRQSGLHPSPEQLADIQQHVDVIQATTGKRFTYERAGKSQPTVGEDGVVRYPGVGDSQQFWNELLKRSGATGRAELSKQSKPDDATIDKIRQRLIHEAALSKTIASTIRKGLPSDHVENPAAPAKVPQNAVAPATKSIELSPEMVANKYGLQYRGEVSPGTQVHDFRHPDGGSFALRASELGNDEFIQAKLAKRAQEIKPEELHPVAAAKAEKTVTVKRYDEAGNLMAEAPMRVPATLPTKELTAGEAHEELQATNRHLANLENKGLGQSKAAQRVRKTIDQLQRVAPQSAEDTAHLQNIASSAIRTVERAERQNAPKTFMEPINRVAEGKGDAILALLGSTAGEEVPAKWLGDILKLHDATVPEDRDFLAYTAIQAAQKAGIEDTKFLAKRYGGALEALYRGLRKGDGPAALQAATRWAETGKLGVAIPKKGQEGFVVIPPFIPHILNELGKYASNAAVTTKDVLDWAQRWAELGSYRDVSEQSKNAMYKFRGELNRVEDLGRIAFNEGLNVYRHLPDQTGIDAMTRWRKGLPLHTPDAEGQRQIMQQLLDKAYVEAHTYRPSLNFLTDYLGSIWKKPPTNSAVLHEKSAQVINDAMLSGDKGMLRKRVFETVEDGIAAGGVPATTNPFEMALLSWGRLQQYIHVNKTLLPEIKMQGRLAHGGQELEALKNAGTLTDPVRVPDNIVSSWFARPTATGGMEVLKGQPYYMQRGELEMLKNHVSRDFVRQNVVGKTILDLKNIYTPIELFGPFHAMGIVAKSMAMGVNRGVNQAVNAGMMQGNLSEAVAGLGQLFKGLAEPYLAYKNGRALREAGGQTIIGWQKYQYSLQNFLATPQGKRLSAAIPNIEDTVEAMLQAGVRFDQNPLYATKWRESFLKNNFNVLEAFRQHNYLEGAARGTVGNAALGPLALLETFTSPLFQRAIPAIKLFATAKEINVELKRNAPMIQSGEISKEKVLQTAARRVDDTLGELNFDNLNASKGFKSALAMVVRSPGWRVGIMNIMKNAAYNQAADFVGSVKNRRAPSLDPDFSLLMTMLGGMTALVGAIIMQVFAHKAPTSPLDFQAPQIGGLDSRGKPNRVDPPLYNRDVRTFFGDASVGHPKDIPFELLKGTTSYLVGGQTGFITKGVEAAKNRTFEGGMVTDRSGFSGLFDRAVHTIAPVPFSVTGYQKMKSQGIPTGKALWLSGLALNPSARDLDMTEAEKVLSTADRRATYNFDARELTKRHLTQAIEGAIRSQQSEQLPDLQKQALTPDANGKSYLSFSDVKKAFENANKPYIVRMAEGSSVRPKDLVKAYMVATPEEQALILPYVWRAIRKDPEQFKVFSKYQQSRPKGIEGMN